MTDGTKNIDSLIGFADEAGNWEYSCKPWRFAPYWETVQKLCTVALNPWYVVSREALLAIFILVMFNYEG